MNAIYQNILTSIEKREQLLAVLIDPDKMLVEKATGFVEKVNQSIANYIFVGGSEVNKNATEVLVSKIKELTNKPIILFPGDITQITEKANGLLFLSLISGRNPDYLIGKHIEVAASLKASNLEIIPTGYILIENGKETSVQRVTKTEPMLRNNVRKIVDTALAGQMLGQKLIYLEAGSGARHPVPLEVISEVKQAISIPLIVGGGIRSKEQLLSAYNAGADIVVIGTAFEEDETFFNELI